MERSELTAWKRQTGKKREAHKLRSSGLVPGILYGRQKASIPITVKPDVLQKAIATKAGLNTLIDLSIEGEGQKGSFTALVKDYQLHPITRKLLHVDLLAIDINEKISVMIPIQLNGKPEGVKKGGILQHVLREMEVICLPLQIPEKVEVDVSFLEIGKSIHLADMKLPEGIETHMDKGTTIAAVIAPVIEVAPTPAAEVAEGVPAEGAEAGKPVEPGKEAEAKEGAKKPEGAKEAAPAKAAAKPAGKEAKEGKKEK
jgi:large subunit ribosomal protein L25